MRAENSTDKTPWSAAIEIKTWTTQLAPPSNVKADAASSTSIKVSWNAVPGATGYKLQKWGEGWTDVGTPNDNGATTATTSQTDNTNLSAATTYSYRVQAVNASGMSTWSAVTEGTTKHGTTSAPTLVATSTGESMIRLSWKGVSGATGYMLEWAEDAAGFNFANATIPRNKETLNGNLRHYVHTGLKAGTRYNYRIQAVLPQSVTSAWTDGQVQYTKPVKPELTATDAISSSITLKWDAVPFIGATDDAATGHLTDASNYTVQRRMAGGGVWANVTLSGTVCDATTNKCSFVDGNGEGNLTANTRYYYRIRATVTRTDTYTSYWDYANQRTTSN